MGLRSGGAETASEASGGRAPVGSPDHLPDSPRRSKTELNALAKAAYSSTGDAARILENAALTPREKAYLATQPEFQDFIIAIMYDGVVGIERTTKSQRSTAAWFFRVIKDHADEKDAAKNGRIPKDAVVVDTSGEDEG